MTSSRRLLAGVGTQNEALAFGGFISNASQNTEEYNGTSWSAGSTSISARSGLSGAGTQNMAMTIGLGCTEEYNGVSWSVGGVSLITARQNLAGAGTSGPGTQFSGLAMGGGLGVACTEEYSKAIIIFDCYL